VVAAVVAITPPAIPATIPTVPAIVVAIIAPFAAIVAAVTAPWSSRRSLRQCGHRADPRSAALYWQRATLLYHSSRTNTPGASVF
jgi:hypothetical protein